MIPAAWLLAAGLVFGDEPSTPAAGSPAPVVDVDRQNTLAEMRERKIISDTSDYWGPSDRILLQRMRRAEAGGAFDLLRDELGSLRGLVVEHRSGTDRVLWLTKWGFNRYQFLKSQKARQFFEDQGEEAAVIFKLKDPLGKRIFTPKGILTTEGEELYDRAADGYPIRWTEPSGKIVSSDSPRPESDEAPGADSGKAPQPDSDE